MYNQVKSPVMVKENFQSGESNQSTHQGTTTTTHQYAR